MTRPYVPPRTFGDLLKARHESDGLCRFCKQYTAVRQYSTRALICEPCIEQRKDVELPSVKRHEKFKALMAAAGSAS